MSGFVRGIKQTHCKKCRVYTKNVYGLHETDIDIQLLSIHDSYVSRRSLHILKGIMKLNKTGLEASASDGVKNILCRRQVEAKTDLKKSQLYGLGRVGIFPKPMSLGIRTVGWIESRVKASRPTGDM